MIIHSRAFNFNVDGMTQVIMVPFADMYNHANPGNATWYYDKERKAYINEAREDI